MIANPVLALTLRLFVVMAATDEAAAPAPPGVPAAAEFVEFAQRLESETTAGNTEFFNDNFRVDLCLRRGLKGLRYPDNLERDFKTGYRGPSRLGDTIVRGLGQGGAYRLLWVRQVGKDHRAMFRLSPGMEGTNYHELHLGQGQDGAPMIYDLYILSAGELFSKTLRNLLLPSIQQASGEGLSKLLPAESDLVKYGRQIRGMSAAMRAGQYAEAMALYDQLPESLQKQKAFQLIHVMASAEVDQTQYVENMRRFARDFADDPSTDLVLIDFYFLQNQFDEVRACVDRIDRRVGGDRALDVYRANALRGKGEIEPAKKILTDMCDSKESEIVLKARSALIEISLEEKDFPETARQLTAIEALGVMLLDDLSNTPPYEDFAKSPEYRQWQSTRKAGAATAE